MLPKNLKVLKRSISEKILGNKASASEKLEQTTQKSGRLSGSSQFSQDEEDPYREILRTYNDNVSHLVFHGSSLQSLRVEFGCVYQSEPNTPFRRVRFERNHDIRARNLKNPVKAL
ncbi:hypothetical protein OESDEN_02015 [Oesophagostomum dentatum]|uniref:Uncharacterized protein n=1 Tax=Oesophagostomum dentatum TaxID=61180 RepID=A0A0B1TPG5_OESDE|nr:hypothetical protein OESDEN_02015 [Oesophagostomum dentatum]